MIHEKDGASHSDSQQDSHEEQDCAEQVAAAHSLWKKKKIKLNDVNTTAAQSSLVITKGHQPENSKNQPNQRNRTQTAITDVNRHKVHIS